MIYAKYSKDSTKKREQYFIGRSLLSLKTDWVRRQSEPDVPSYGVLILKVGSDSIFESLGQTLSSSMTESLEWRHLVYKDMHAFSSKVAELNWISVLNPRQEQTGIEKALLMQVIRGINDALASSSYDLINQFFREANTATAAPQVSVALLRSTYSHKEKLNSWKKFLRETKTAFIARSINPDETLRGLL